jgi:uncharacterized protein YebE (UPF0316 family)
MDAVVMMMLLLLKLTIVRMLLLMLSMLEMQIVMLLQQRSLCLSCNINPENVLHSDLGDGVGIHEERRICIGKNVIEIIIIHRWASGNRAQWVG